MKNLVILMGFVPWIVFTLVAQQFGANRVAWAAVIAVALTLFSVITNARKHGPKILNLGTLVLFGAIAVAGFAGGPDVDAWLYRWGVPLVGVVLGIYVLATVPVLPFTAEYARQGTPRQYWGSPTFIKINRVLSAAWGVAILVMGLLSVAVSALGGKTGQADDNQFLDLLLNWILPVAIVWFMVKFTVAYPDRVRGHAHDEPADTRTSA